MLARALQHEVSHHTRVKGVRYFRSGAVREITPSERGVTAIVRGTFDYHVTIDHESGGFVATCECPYFTDRVTICKHIWAVVLTPEAERVLASQFPIPKQTWIDPGAVREDEPVRRGPERASAGESREAWRHFLGEIQRGAASATVNGRSPNRCRSSRMRSRSSPTNGIAKSCPC